MERDARARAMVSEEDRDEDDSGDEAGAGGVEGWHGKYTFSIKKTEPAKKLRDAGAAGRAPRAGWS